MICLIDFCFLFVQDYSLNLAEVRELTLKFQPEIVLIESGGDNLAANFSRELADYIIYVIDVAGNRDEYTIMLPYIEYVQIKTLL